MIESMPTQSDEPLWLTIDSGGNRQAFLFEADEDDTVVVGGSSEADFRIWDTSPLCFYVERDDKGLRLIPGYVDGLRFNTFKLMDSIALPPHSVVEFGRHRLDLAVQSLDSSTPSTRYHAQSGSRDREEITTERTCDDALETRAVTAPILDSDEDLPTTVLEAPNDDAQEPPRSQDDISTEPEPLTAHAPVIAPESLAPSPIDDEPAFETRIMGSIPEFEQIYPGYDDEWHPHAPYASIGPNEKTPIDGRRTPELAESLRETAPPVSGVSAPRARTTGGFHNLRIGLRKVEEFAKMRPKSMLGSGLGIAFVVGLLVAVLTKAEQPQKPLATGEVASALAETHEKPGSAVPDERSIHADNARLDPEEIDRAIKHLIAGRYKEAALAYRELAQKDGASSDITHMYRLLRLHTNPLPNDEPRPKGMPDIYQ